MAFAACVLIAGCAASRPREKSGDGEPAPRPRTPTTGTLPANPPPPPVSDAWRHAGTLRIGLKTGASQLLVSGSRDWKLTTDDGKEIASLVRGVPLRLALGSGRTIEIYRQDQAGPIGRADEDDTLLVVPGEQGFSGWNARWYRGTFRIYASTGQGLTLVNAVGLEDYLRGVLPEEIGIPPESDYEAVKAQAVAARSYTLSYLGRRADLGFDLWATVEDQVYGGTLRENAQSNRAIESTRGEVLLSEGAPIRALYSSACGGRTANVEDVWPWPWTAYLRSVRDADASGIAYCSRAANYRWREEWNVDDFVAMLRKYAPQDGASGAVLAGNLLDIRVGSRSRSGRVRELVVTTTQGDTMLRGDRTRWSLRRPGGEAILRSSFFKIGVLRAPDGAPLKVIATGGGNGHGIGMCQWGAMGMARAGMAYREILRHYYKGTQLARL